MRKPSASEPTEGRRAACDCLRQAGTALRATLSAALLSVVGLGACSRSEPPQSRHPPRPHSLSAYDPATGSSASPRITQAGERIRKGGGSYKVGEPYKISGRWYTPRIDPSYDRTGVASWYGDAFHGRRTANGEIYDMMALSAAHPTLPLPSYVWVTNLENGRTLLVRVNDRGPYAHDRIIDLSLAVARAIGSEGRGLARVRVRYAGPAPINGDDRRELAFLASQPWYRSADLAPETPDRGVARYSHAVAGRLPRPQLTSAERASVRPPVLSF